LTQIMNSMQPQTGRRLEEQAVSHDWVGSPGAAGGPRLRVLDQPQLRHTGRRVGWARLLKVRQIDAAAKFAAKAERSPSMAPIATPKRE
jgi:hypothetical protein